MKNNIWDRAYQIDMKISGQTIDDFLCDICYSWDDSLTPDDMVCESCHEFAICPACGNPIDYCQGHGPMGDSQNYAILQLHDDDIHHMCHASSDCNYQDYS